jgi:hypothetical protein
MANQSNDLVSPEAVAADIAREYRENASHWTQGWIARDREGADLWYVKDPSAVCWCLRGAIDKRIDPWTGAIAFPIYLAFDRALGFNIASEDEHGTLHFVRWNDRPGRTVGDVIALCEAVAHGTALKEVSDGPR